MANWNNPTLTSTYTNFVQECKDRDTDSATMFGASGTNVPTGAIRWNTSTSIFERWSGSAWVAQPVSIAGGGTGATTQTAARTALGLVIGTNVQAYATTLTTLAGLTPTLNNFIVGSGSTWTSQPASTARTNLGAQTQNTKLDNISATTFAADQFIYFTSATAVAATPITSVARTLLSQSTQAQLRSTGLGLGSLAVLNTINNSNWSGTDLAIENGGTNASTALQAKRNLGIYPGYVASDGTGTFVPGWTSTHPSTGNYTITHNLGLTDYVVVANATAIISNGRHISVSKGNNSFSVRIFEGGSGNAADADWNFILTN